MTDNDITPYREHHEAVRKEFRKQGPSWAAGKNDDHLNRIIGGLELPADHEVLDVAAGSGLLARVLAPHVKRVVACDITPEMFEHADLRGADNVVFEQAAAEDLPYADGSFDMIATRFSIHHFQDPGPALKEMCRVCRPGGTLLIIDLVAPEDGALADRYNALERLRDPTHTEAPALTRLQQMVEDAGFAVRHCYSREVEMDLEDWYAFNQADVDARQRIREAIAHELDGQAETGMQPFLKADRVWFIHTWGIVLGDKP